jgi:hypothetical protein
VVVVVVWRGATAWWTMARGKGRLENKKRKQEQEAQKRGGEVGRI